MAALPVVPERKVAKFDDELDEMFGKQNKYRKSSKQLMEKLCPLSSIPLPLAEAPAILLSSEEVPQFEVFSDDDLNLSTSFNRERSRSEGSSTLKKFNWRQRLSWKFWSSSSSPKPQEADMNVVQFVDKGKEKEALEILFTRYSYGGTMMTSTVIAQSPVATSSSKPQRKVRRKSSSDSSVLFMDQLKDNSSDKEASSRRKSRS